MHTMLPLLALAATATGQVLTSAYVEENHEALWASFKGTYNRTYAADEEGLRRAVFKTNMLRAAALQRESATATFGATKFSDMTDEEMRSYTHGFVPAPHVNYTEVPKMYSDEEVATVGSKDWRSEGVVTAVKNQGMCGSCWSFSTTGVIESGNAIRGNKQLVSLSEQELVSCIPTIPFACSGCNGGNPMLAVQYLFFLKGGKVVTEEAYPYVSGGKQNPPCKNTAGMPVGAKIGGTVLLPPIENQLAAWLVEKGPISIAVDATSWMSYRGGVLDNCQNRGLDHAVLLVGVTPEFWVIKNSWGADWGESGFVRVKYGQNSCGLAQSPMATSF